MLKLVCGTRIGSFNATWPLVRLRVFPDYMELNIIGIKRIRVLNEDILSVAPYDSVPLIGRGVVVKTKYKKKYGKLFFERTDQIIIWILGNREKHLGEILKIMDK